MAQNHDDPVALDVLRQERELTNRADENDLTMLRVQSRKSAHGDEIHWTEEVPKPAPFKSNESAETVIGEKGEEIVDRGSFEMSTADRNRSDCI